MKFRIGQKDLRYCSYDDLGCVAFLDFMYYLDVFCVYFSDMYSQDGKFYLETI
jgi:hypothetical protein